MHLDIQVIVRGPARGHELKHYQQYLEHLYQQVLLLCLHFLLLLLILSYFTFSRYL